MKDPLENNIKHVLVVMQASSLDSPYLSTGGVDTVSKTLLYGFEKYTSKSFKYTFLIFDPLNSFSNRKIMLGEHVCYIENIKRKKIPTFIYNALIVRKYIEIVKPDILHCHQDSWILGAVFKNLKKVVTLHGYRNICRKKVSFINDVIYEKILPDISDLVTDLYTCVSESFKGMLPKKITKKTLVVNNPISLNFKKDFESVKNYYSPVFIFTGLLIPRKKVEICLNVLSLTRKKNIDAKLLIVGPRSDFEYVEFLLNKIKELDLCKYVTFLGHLPSNELNDLYNRCHFGMSFSSEETFGLVPLEMSNSGLIVFSTAVGVLSERAFNQGSIYTYMPYETDIANKVAKEVVRICQKHGVIDESNFRLSDFSVESIISSYEKIYCAKNEIV